MCNIDFKINEQNGMHRQTRRAGAERETDRETFLPYVTRIGQLVAQYLKDAVYLTSGRQLLTLQCTQTSTHTDTHTGIQ